MRVKLLPLTMTAVFLLLAVKVAAVVRGGEEIARLLTVSAAEAQDAATEAPQEGEQPAAAEASKETPPKEETLNEKTSEEKPAEKPAEGEAKPAEAPAAADPHAAQAEQEMKGGEETAAGSIEAKKTSVEGRINPEPPGEGEDPNGGKGLAPGAHYFSPTELFILQNLSKRREQLDDWQKQIEIKENLLANVEKRVDEKVTQMQGMQTELKELIVQYDGQEDAKIKSLVKIYENMKPRDAARIFDEVEMPILLLVIDRMSEKKAAPVLANMDAKKAKQLTVALAEQRRVQGSQLGSNCLVPLPPSGTPAASAAAGAR